MSDGPGLSIGEVINLLSGEFPEVSVSKVRFLEHQGLIRPGRSPGGYRQFFEDDVRRLRFILQQQRDHFLPLKVIKSKLTMWEKGEELATPSATHTHFEPSGSPWGRGELLRKSGLTDGQLSQLQEQGLLVPLEPGDTEDGDDGEDAFSPGSLDIAVHAQRLLAYGFEPRHLRAVRLGSEREAELLRQLTAPLRRQHSPDAKRRLTETLAGCVESIEHMRTALLDAEIKAILSP